MSQQEVQSAIEKIKKDWVSNAIRAELRVTQCHYLTMKKKGVRG